MKILNLKPMGNYVVVSRKPSPRDRRTEGGIVLPDEMQSQTPQTAMGTIIRVGPHANRAGPNTDVDVPEDDVSHLKVGDDVVFNPWPMQGCTVTLDGGMSAQVLLPRTDIFSKYTLDEPTPADLKKMKELKESNRPSSIIVVNSSLAV